MEYKFHLLQVVYSIFAPPLHVVVGTVDVLLLGLDCCRTDSILVLISYS